MIKTISKHITFKQEEILNKIIKLLEVNDLRWLKEWEGGLAKNYITKKEYRGINAFVCNIDKIEHKYKSNFYLTFLQVQKLKGHLKAGSIGVPIFYWDIREKEITNDAGETEKRKMFFLRNYVVFNIEQTDIKVKEEENKVILTPLESCENVVASYKDKPVIEFISQSKAYYSPLDDRIVLPLKEQFKNIFAFYSTQFHELSHSTGHEKRLKRDGIMKTDFFGGDIYGEEEIIAELSTIFLCASAGIEHETLNNNTAYIKGWLDNIRKDKTFLFKVISKGQKSADYIVKNKMEMN